MNVDFPHPDGPAISNIRLLANNIINFIKDRTSSVFQNAPSICKGLFGNVALFELLLKGVVFFAGAAWRNLAD